jgi:hypothetical protein
MQRGPGGEIDEQKGSFVVDRQVAKAVEHVVSGVIRPPQLAGGVDPDESGRTSPVRRVASACGMGGAQEEGVGRCNHRVIHRF